LRDLLVFLALFWIGLVVWSTGLFSAAARPPPAVEQETRPAQQPDPVAGLPGESGASERASRDPQPERPVAPPAVVARPVARAARQRPPGSTEAAATGTAAEATRLADPIRRIAIPAIRLDAAVVYVPYNGETWDMRELGQHVAWLGAPAEGSFGENLALAGHVTLRRGEPGPFRLLSRLSAGAEIAIYTDALVYTYRMREYALVQAEDSAVITATAEPQLTLVTCETWDEPTKSYLRRRVIFADLVKVEQSRLVRLD
jgi:LPXTG-site transpeptidase (sortase) family protein